MNFQLAPEIWPVALRLYAGGPMSHQRTGRCRPEGTQRIGDHEHE